MVLTPRLKVPRKTCARCTVVPPQSVWCGMVGVRWCAVAWCGVVRCGAVWCGVVWYEVLCCAVRFAVVVVGQIQKMHTLVGKKH